jgi:hypothetical protein
MWASWRRLYPLYSALAREFVLELHPCAVLEEQVETPSAQAVEGAEKWFVEMDSRIQIHQLRQFAQTSPSMNETALRDFVLHHLHKQDRSDHDRDKVDFLLVQLFSQNAPAQAREADLSIRVVAKVLEAVLGPVEISAPEFLKPVNDLLQEASRAKSLNTLFTSRVIERGRQLKASRGEKFFEPLTLAAFTRFGFLIRRTFFRLMQQDLNVIVDGLRALEARGVTTLDCRKAQFSAEEPVARLRMICSSWRVMFQAEYSSGQPLCLLVDLRTAVESALMQSPKGTKSKVKAVAAAAAGDSAPGADFEVSAPSPEPADADDAGSGGKL